MECESQYRSYKNWRQKKVVRDDVVKQGENSPTYGWYEHLAKAIMASRVATEEENMLRAEGGAGAGVRGATSTSYNGDEDRDEMEVLVDKAGFDKAFGDHVTNVTGV